MAAASDHLFDRMREIEQRVLRDELGLSSHEKECALRYEALWREVKTVRWIGASILLVMFSVLGKLVFFT